jgi:hypothetical protein
MKLKKTGDHIPKLIAAIKMLWVMDMNMAYFKKLASSFPRGSSSSSRERVT